MIPISLSMRLGSLLVSDDTLTAIVINFGPKLLKVMTTPDTTHKKVWEMFIKVDLLHPRKEQIHFLEFMI
jgi:hypothetical protein